MLCSLPLSFRQFSAFSGLKKFSLKHQCLVSLRLVLVFLWVLSEPKFEFSLRDLALVEEAMVAMVASAAMASSIRATPSISSSTSRIHVVLASPVEASSATDRKGACQARTTPGKLRTSGSRRQALVVSAMSRREPDNVQVAELSPESARKDVLGALSQIIDPDFGTDIVSCGFVKELSIEKATGQVSFQLELTTPACPVKDMFEQQAKEKVSAIAWVKGVAVKMTAQPAKLLIADDVPAGLKKVSNVVAVSSCKGGVGKSTVAVNLAYSLAQMGARVGIFDADIYGPSLPTMVSPEVRVLQMNPETRSIIPTEYLGVKLVSFGYAGQGSAIMRGPMVSGVINQFLTTTDWGELDYLVIDMPPGTGDIQLTLCQVVPLTAAVIVTTPQKLAFIDVAKGVRMFSKLKVPCIAVVENMCFFEGDDKRYYPFGRGSGAQVVQQFGIPNLFELPIRPELSASGDTGNPEVVVDPQGQVADIFSNIGVCVVQQCAKLRQQVSTAVMYDKSINAIRVKVPGTAEEFLLHPATVRRNDRSARSIDEWSGEQKLRYSDVVETIEPESIRPMGNYAVAINWPDGFSQIAPYDQLAALERLVDVPEAVPIPENTVASSDSPVKDAGAAAILRHARRL